MKYQDNDKDFGVVYLETNINKEEFKVYDRLAQFMKDNGYNTEYCDICNVEYEFEPEQVNVKFKFVHYSVKTAATEPYWSIIFKEA